MKMKKIHILATPQDEVTLLPHAELNDHQILKISNQLVANVPLDCSPSIQKLPVSGRVLVTVEGELIQYQGVLAENNKHVIMVLSRTLRSTMRATSIESATLVTIGGIPKMMLDTTGISLIQPLTLP